MIYRCTGLDCGFLMEDEDGKVREACPVCGKPVKSQDESRLTGGDWSRLGIFWTEMSEEQETKEEMERCEKKAYSCALCYWQP